MMRHVNTLGAAVISVLVACTGVIGDGETEVSSEALLAGTSGLRLVLPEVARVAVDV